MAIIGLQGLRFGVPDLDKAKSFLREWNLEPVEEGQGMGCYATREGAQIVVRDEADTSFPAAAAPGVTIREIVWAIETDADIDNIASALQEAGHAFTRSDDGTLHTVDPNGYGLAFVKSSLKQLDPVSGDVNFPGTPVRKNRAVNFDERPAVLHLGHTAVFVPKLDATIAFYTEVLQFRVSDKYPDRGIFLRAPGSHDHHNIFLVHRGDMLGFHHMSFGVNDFHQVMLGGMHMRKQGWKTQMGPGRHRLGSNYFWYFLTPFGGASEYYSDMDYLDDSWEVRSWDYTPDMIAAWTAEMPELPEVPTQR